MCTKIAQTILHVSLDCIKPTHNMSFGTHRGVNNVLDSVLQIQVSRFLLKFKNSRFDIHKTLYSQFQ